MGKVNFSTASRRHYWEQFQANRAINITQGGIKLPPGLVVVEKDKANVAFNSMEDFQASSIELNADRTLRYDDHIAIRDKIIEIRKSNLFAADDLVSAGLSVPHEMGNQYAQIENMSDLNDDAVTEMNPKTTDNDGLVFDQTIMPVPVTHKTAIIGWRQQGFAYLRDKLVTSLVDRVSRKLESNIFNGSGITVTDKGLTGVTYGYLTLPNRSTGTISDWTNSANVDSIVPEFREELGEMWSEQFIEATGTIQVYVSRALYAVLMQQTYTDGNVTANILATMEAEAMVRGVRPSDQLTGSAVIMVEMAARSVELYNGGDITVFPWMESQSPFADFNLTGFAAQQMHLQEDRNGTTGVRHLTV